MKKALKVISWTLGIIFLLTSLGFFSSGKVISGLFALAICIVLMPVTINFIENKFNLHLSKVIKAVILIICFIGIGANSNPTSTTQNQPVNNKPSQESNQPQSKVEKEVKQWPNIDINDANVKSALKSVKLTSRRYDPKDIKKIEIKDNLGTQDPNDKIVNIYIKPSAAADETYTAKQMAETMTSYSQILFKHKDIQSVNLWGLVDMVDKYGNASEASAIRIGWNKEISAKINYENFENMVLSDYTKAYNISENYYIHPGIFSKLKGANGLDTSGGNN